MPARAPEPTIVVQNSRLLWLGVGALLLITGLAVPTSGLSVDLTSNTVLLVLVPLYNSAAIGKTKFTSFPEP